MKKGIIAFCLLTILLPVKAQVIRRPLSAAYTGVNAYSSRQADAFSFTGNQAALAHMPRFSAGIYSERRFLLQELSLYQLAVVIPTASGSFGLCGTYMGSVEQNESKVGLAYGRKLSNWLNACVQFNYHTLHTAGYGSASAISIEAAALVAISEQLHIGVQINNPSKAKIGKEDAERLPLIYAIGLGYEPSENLLLMAAVEKIETEPLNIKTGLQYKLNDIVAARGGVETATASFYFGLGIMLPPIRLDAIATIHPQLGLTPGLMLTYIAAEKP